MVFDIGNATTEIVVATAGYFADGQYEFQIVGYTMDADGKTLTRVGALAGCCKAGPGGLNDNNDFALFVANPIAGTDTCPVGSSVKERRRACRIQKVLSDGIGCSCSPIDYRFHSCDWPSNSDGRFDFVAAIPFTF